MAEFGNFFKNKKVLVTGHTGFKGAWLTIWLKEMGADVIGYALEPPYENSIFELAHLEKRIIHMTANVCDLKSVEKVFKQHQPEIVIHLAGQAIVRLAYDIPRETMDTNIMGTVNILECMRKYPVKSAVMITSDKCYQNREIRKGYIESDILGDTDPYGCSKGAAELVIECYRKSFKMKVASPRAGNVIGGGDWAKDRLVPDTARALLNNQEEIILRNPGSVRPWQLVLEPLAAYLMLAKRQYEGEDLSEGWNFGPDPSSMITVKEVVEKITKEWGKGRVKVQQDASKKEAQFLFLDCSKAKKKLKWKPKTDIDDAISFIVEWYKNYQQEDVYQLCAKQIRKFESL